MLEERCFPRTRYDIKDILRTINVASYDPEEIIKVTKGRVTDDREWIYNEKHYQSFDEKKTG